MTELTCPKCGMQNRAGARFCQKCGGSLEIYDLTTPPASAPSTASGALAPVRHPEINDLPQTSPEAPIVLEGLVQHGARYVPVGGPLDLAHSIYHRAYKLVCGICSHVNPPAALGRCQRCKATLPTVLLRQARRKLGSDDAYNVVALSEWSPFILRHLDVVRWNVEPAMSNGGTFLVLSDPDGLWRSPVKMPLPLDTDQVIVWAGQIGRALAALHDRGFVLHDIDSAGLEGIIIDGDVAKLADLSSAKRLPIEEPDLVRRQIARDTAFLAKFTYHLATGQDLERQPTTGRLVPGLRLVVEKGVRGEYDNIATMLAELTNPNTAQATFLRSLRQNYGIATHPGRVKQNNQDAVAVFNFVREPGNMPVGLYLVADGMGGHAAGEVASATINRIVTHRLLQQEVLDALTDDTGNLTKSPGTILSKAIQKANRVIWEMNREQGSNMGTVIVAALIINDKAVIAAVGDSRVYLLRDTELGQITTDHSVVARLLETGAIETDQARTHPSRNQVYRSLGEKNTVEIDIHIQPLQPGDRLLLCCDGLWDMLPDQNILRIVARAPSLQSACDDLVRAANDAGGEDNISVILVRME